MRRAEGTRPPHPAFILLSIIVQTWTWSLLWAGETMNGLNYFMVICENVQSHESKCTIPKRIRSSLVIFWSAMQFFLLFLQNCVLLFQLQNPRYKLVLLLEKYLFLCKYPNGYFESKCQDTVKKKEEEKKRKIIMKKKCLLLFF